MQKQPKRKEEEGWPRKVKFGRVTVPVYRRRTPTGAWAFMVANYAEGKRRFDSHADEAVALEEALKLAKRLSERDTIGAAMRKEDALEYASAVQTLKPFNVTLTAAANTVAEALGLVGSLGNLADAVRFAVARRKPVTRKPVAEVVAEMLAVKSGRGASKRYAEDLRFRLNKFAADCQKDAGEVATADVQSWLDGQPLAAQSYQNFRRTLHALFAFAVARGYAADNPVAGVERVSVKGGEVEIFTPEELWRLLNVASPDILPCIALGAFAGLRSAEIERLEWSDIDLASGHIVIGKDKAKTASRRVVPVNDALRSWLAVYGMGEGKVWRWPHRDYYEAQEETAAATRVEADAKEGIRARPPVKWKANGLRHSYASYRFAEIADAGRVAAELGNSAAVVHKHYRELVKPADAKRYFGLRPEGASNVVRLGKEASA